MCASKWAHAHKQSHHRQSCVACGYIHMSILHMNIRDVVRNKSNFPVCSTSTHTHAHTHSFRVTIAARSSFTPALVLSLSPLLPRGVLSASATEEWRGRSGTGDVVRCLCVCVCEDGDAFRLAHSLRCLVTHTHAHTHARTHGE